MQNYSKKWAAKGKTRKNAKKMLLLSPEIKIKN